MATATTQPTVTLDRDQRQICCELLWEEIHEGCTRDEAGRVQLMMAAARLFEAVDWRNPDPDRDAWTVEVDDEIAWLAEDFFQPFVTDYARPALDECAEEVPSGAQGDIEAMPAWLADKHAREMELHRAVIAATDAITDAVA